MPSASSRRKPVIVDVAQRELRTPDHDAQRLHFEQAGQTPPALDQRGLAGNQCGVRAAQVVVQSPGTSLWGASLIACPGRGIGGGRRVVYVDPGPYQCCAQARVLRDQRSLTFGQAGVFAMGGHAWV
jgi:hypothetical protein